ncbi:hypothetical protein KQI52_11685 [bacterium]|nr:hypothetical protein [bacterium]
MQFGRSQFLQAAQARALFLLVHQESGVTRRVSVILETDSFNVNAAEHSFASLPDGSRLRVRKGTVAGLQPHPLVYKAAEVCINLSGFTADRLDNRLQEDGLGAIPHPEGINLALLLIHLWLCRIVLEMEKHFAEPVAADTARFQTMVAVESLFHTPLFKDLDPGSEPGRKAISDFVTRHLAMLTGARTNLNNSDAESELSKPLVRYFISEILPGECETLRSAPGRLLEEELMRGMDGLDANNYISDLSVNMILDPRQAEQLLETMKKIGNRL